MNDLDAMYQQIILDAARERHGEGELAEFDGESFQVNTTCGDQVNMQIKLSDDGTRIENIRWQGQGCSISQASISIMTEMVQGKEISEIAEIMNLSPGTISIPRKNIRKKLELTHQKTNLQTMRKTRTS